MRSLIFVALLLGCSMQPDPQDVEGVGTSEDGIFRTLDLEGVKADKGYAVSRAVVRLRFAGGSVVEDPVARTIELNRASSTEPVRFRFYLRVAESDGGSKVEIFCPIDELDESPGEDTKDPWVPRRERYAQLENDVLHAIWDELMVRPMGNS